MINIPSHRELSVLMERHHGPCVSLFLPIRGAAMETPPHPLRLRNQLREAGHHLLLNDLPAHQVEALLEPMQALVSDESCWLHPAEGLALFRSPDLWRTYWLPCHFQEQVIVTQHFYLRPLLPLLAGDGHCFILLLSEYAIQLFVGTHDGASEVAVPASVQRSPLDPKKDTEAANALSSHSRSGAAARGSAGRRESLVQRPEGGIDDEQEPLLRSFRQLDAQLQERLRDEHAPLVLAGVPSLLVLYRQVNTYAHLLEQSVPGTPDTLNLETLHKQAWNLVAPSFLRARQQAAARYRASAATGRVCDSLREILSAAHAGRVESLFVASDQEQWGIYHATSKTLHVHREARFNDDDLLDIAATQTLLHGGSVYAVEQASVPAEAPLAAVFRS